MKKRLLSAFLASAIVLSMTSCGDKVVKKPSHNDDDDEDEEIVATIDEDEDEDKEDEEIINTTVVEENPSDAPELTEVDTTEVTTTEVATTEETTTTEEPAAPVELANVERVSSFAYSDSLLFETDDGKMYAYNVNDNILYEYDGEGYINYISGNFASIDGKLYNYKTNEFYESYHSFFNEEYAYVITLEESFDGNVYSFGVLDKDGKWALPLSSDNVISDLYKNQNGFVSKASSQLIHYGIYNDVGSYLYDWKNDKVINLNDLDIPLPTLPPTETTNHPYQFSNVVVSGMYENSVLLYAKYHASAIDPDYYSYIKFDASTGECTLLSSGYKEIRDVGKGNFILPYDFYYSKVVELIDQNFNMLVRYDLSEYDNIELQGVTEDYISFYANNPDGTQYTIILDKEGNRVIEPFKGYIYNIYGDFIEKDDGTILNFVTGETFEFDYRIDNYVELIDKYLVYFDYNYYFVDMSAPDNLINPLEIVDYMNRTTN